MITLARYDARYVQPEEAAKRAFNECGVRQAGYEGYIRIHSEGNTIYGNNTALVARLYTKVPKAMGLGFWHTSSLA